MAQIWAPHVIDHIDKSQIDLYLKFSATPCIQGGGCNVDKALRVLYESNGDIKMATQQLLAIRLNDQTVWTHDEVKTFERLLRLHRKDFHQISQDLATKTVKECVLYYYLWKKRKPISLSLKYQHQQQVNQISTSSDVVKNNNNVDDNNNNDIQPVKLEPQEESFPCRVCGRVFAKIKSRSAHMKRHKNER